MVLKALEFSKNLMLFLPRNTSIINLITELSRFSKQIHGGRDELLIEVQQLMYGESCKALLVMTGDLAKIDSKEVAAHF